jgi:hypothetical protein
MSFFSFTKSENRRYQWEGQEVWKGHGRVNIVHILCMHACKWKNDTYSRNNGGIKENYGWVNSSDIFDIL